MKSPLAASPTTETAFSARLTLTALIFGMLAAVWSNTAEAEVIAWTLGGDEGLTWQSQQSRSTAIDFDTPGAIQLAGFTSKDNIVTQLGWEDKFPPNFISERAEAYIWDNISLKRPNLPIVDGDDTTSTDDRFKRFGVSQAGTRIFLDLGTRFPANRILFFPRQEGADDQGRPFSTDFIRSYDLFINDGASFNQENAPIYNILRREDFTRESITEIIFPLQFIRFIQLHVTASSPFELAEFQVYGTGFAPGGTYVSKVIDLGEAANYSRIEWTLEKLSQEIDSLVVNPNADANVSVVMRTGLDEDPLVYYEFTNIFTKERQVVSQSDYNRLDENLRGPIEDDIANWSPWSAPFTTSGQTIDLPSPRRYFQLEIRLASRAILDGVRVSSIDVIHTIPPVAQQLIGEVSQTDDPRPTGNVATVEAGVFSSFAYDLAANLADNDTGFDALRILTPSALPVFKEFLVGEPLVAVSPDSVVEELGSLTLFFPSQRMDVGSAAVLRVIFDAEVFIQGTFFDAEVFDIQSGEVPQRVQPGDANPEVSTNGLRVRTSAASTRDLLPSFEVKPQVFSPNGDNINDGAEVSYTLVQLVRPVQVKVEIFDLAGNKQRTLFSGEESSGAYTWSWDGRDDNGNLLPVGLYLVAVRVEAEQDDLVRTGTMGLVY